MMIETSRKKYIPFILFFRVLTVLIASLLFLKNNQAAYNESLTLVGLIVLSSLIISVFYLFSLEEKQILILVGIEMVGYTLILIPTGGMLSPYFLMIFNPMLSIIQLSKSTKPLIVSAVYFAALVVGLALYTGNFNQLLSQNSILIFSYIMIMMVSFSLIYDLKLLKIHKINLEKNNLDLSDSLLVQTMLNQQFITSIELMDVLDLVSTQKDLLDELVTYLSKSIEDSVGFYLINGEATSDLSEEMLKMDFPWENFNQTNFSHIHFLGKANDQELVYMNFLNDGDCISLCIIKKGFKRYEYDLLTNQFRYVFKLFGITVNRLRMARVKNQMIIKEEQKRIAEEMHDQVNQKIFAVSCLAHQSIETLNKGAVADAGVMMDSLYSHLRNINQEIRTIVYQLGDCKQASTSLKMFMQDFLKELGELYGIEIELDLDEEMTSLPLSVKQFMIRVLNESISNAVRHGKATQVRVCIAQIDSYLKFSIIDNGEGFDVHSLRRENKGLGLDNMMRLAAVYGGNLEINASVTKGVELVFHLNIYGEGGRLIG